MSVSLEATWRSVDVFEEFVGEIKSLSNGLVAWIARGESTAVAVRTASAGRVRRFLGPHVVSRRRRGAAERRYQIQVPGLHDVPSDWRVLGLGLLREAGARRVISIEPDH